MITKAIRFLIFFLFAYSSIIAQKDYAVLDLGQKVPEKFVVIPDTNGNICLFYKDLKNYYFSLITEEGKTIRTRSFKRVTNSESTQPFMGATITDNAFIIFIAASPSYASYSAYHISKTDTNDFKQKETVLKKPQGDKFVRVLTDSQYTYALTYNRKNKKLSFIRFLDEKEVKIFSYIITTDIYNHIKKPDFTLIKSNQNYTVALTSDPKKIYVNEKDKVIFTFDDKEITAMDEECGKTSILEFDFGTDKVAIYKIPQKTKDYENGYSNSFYYKGKLFRIMLLSDQIGLYIIDVKTGNLDKKYEYEKNTKIDLISDKVVHKGENTYLWIEDGEKILLNDSKIFKKLCQGLPAISIKEFKRDTLIALIGSYNIVKQGPLGTTDVAHKMVLAAAGADESIHTTWFNSFLKDSSYEILPDVKAPPDFYKIDKLRQLLEDNGVKMGTYLGFKIKEKIYFGYLSKKEKCFKIVEVL